MPLPPLLWPVVGWLAGKAIDKLLDDKDLSYNMSMEQARAGSAGHGLVLHVVFSGNGVSNIVDGLFVVRVIRNNSYIKSQHSGFSDSDGDITSGNKIILKGVEAVVSAYIPFCAFPDANVTITFEFAIVKTDGRALLPQRWEGVALEASKFVRRNAIAALCDGAIGAIRQNGEVRPEHVRMAKKAIVEAWQLDTHGSKELQQHLRRSNGSPLHEIWYAPERIALDIKVELVGDDRRAALNILYSIAGATGGVDDEADKFLLEIARYLELDAGKIEEVRGPWRVDVHYQTLGISRSATVNEVRRAFHRIAKMCHPDTISELDPVARAAATERFRQAKLAYDALICRMKEC